MHEPSAEPPQGGLAPPLGAAQRGGRVTVAGPSKGASSPASPTTVLAFDFGTRRIGVAVGNTLVRVAHALSTIDSEANDDRFGAIEALVAQWQPARLVVGIPVHADGVEHSMTARARRFARQLEGRFHLRVVETDERYTTEDAKTQLVTTGLGGARCRAQRDALAAQLILQRWFDEHGPA